MLDGFELISDLHKDVFGFRPSQAYYEWFNDLPHAKKQAEWDKLVEELDDQIEDQSVQDVKAELAWDARIEEMMNQFGIDRKTAIRWDIEATGDPEGFDMYGASWYCFTVGIPYSLEAEINQLFNR